MLRAGAAFIDLQERRRSAHERDKPATIFIVQ